MLNPTGNESAKIVPTPDATDFPPVKPKKIDLLCPIRTNAAAITAVMPEFECKNGIYVAKSTGTAPFKASKSITIKNHFLPITRFTLVAPVEPLPTCLISCPVNPFTIKYPVGIEPIKYAAIAAIATFMIAKVVIVIIFPYLIFLLLQV